MNTVESLKLRSQKLKKQINEEKLVLEFARERVKSLQRSMKEVRSDNKIAKAEARKENEAARYQKASLVAEKKAAREAAKVEREEIKARKSIEREAKKAVAIEKVQARLKKLTAKNSKIVKAKKSKSTQVSA